MSEPSPRDTIERLNEFFARAGEWSYDHRWLVLAVCLAILAASGILASRVRFDNSMESFFDRSDPAYAAYLRYRDDFGSDEVALIVYQVPDAQEGPFDLEAMRKIVQLTEALEDEVPFVKEVTSLANTEYLEGVPDGIEIYDLLEEFPETQSEMATVRDKVLAKEIYLDALLSRDARTAAILVEMDQSSVDPVDEIRLDPKGGDGLENLYPQPSFRVIEEILQRPEYAGIRFHHVGDVPVNATMNLMSSRDSSVLALICFGVIGFILALFFRRPVGVLAPLALVALSMMMAVGFSGLLGWNLDMMFVMIPNLLIAVGVAAAVHLISEFLKFHAETGDRREAVRRTLLLVGTPCLLTSITTAAGFASMTVAPIKSIAQFAVIASFGVLASFALSVTLLFVFLSFGKRIRGREASARVKRRTAGDGAIFTPLLEALTRINVRHRKAAIVAWAMIFVLAAAGIARLRVDSNIIDEFAPDFPVRVSTEFVDDTMGGTMSFVYLFDSGESDGIKDPAVLRAIERLQGQADRLEDLVMKSSSIVDILKDINQSFHGGDPAYHVLPESRELIAQYLLIYEMSGGENVENFVSSDFARANLELRTKSADSSSFVELADSLAAYLEREPVEEAEVTLTGIGALWLKLMHYIMQSQIRGFLLALTVISAFLCFIFRSVKIGLVAMVPNIAPVAITVGAMGWLDMPLDYARLLIASVAIGISVDDTIHTVTRYLLEFRRCGSYEDALRRALHSVGRPVIITSIVLVAGFMVFQFAELYSMRSFGVLLSSAILLALAADLLLMPALIITFRSFGPEREQA